MTNKRSPQAIRKAQDAVHAGAAQFRTTTISGPDETGRRHDRRAGRCFLCIGPGTWGKAFTALQAWQNAERPTHFLMFDAPPCCTVDEMGGTCWFPHLYTQPDPEFPALHTIGDDPVEIFRYTAKDGLTIAATTDATTDSGSAVRS